MRIGYHNILNESSVSSLSDVQGFEKENAYDGRTGGYWKSAAVPGWIKSSGRMPIGMWMGDTVAGAASSSELVVPSSGGVDDLSVNNIDLAVYGSLLKSKVVSNTGIVEYSGFSSANYLEQPYNAALEFGSNDFNFTGWVRVSSANGALQAILVRGNEQSGASISIYVNGLGVLSYFSNTTLISAGPSIADNKHHFIAVVRKSSVISIYIDGVKVGGGPDTSNQTTGGGAKLRFGANQSGANPLVNGYLSLWSVEDFALTSNDVKSIYNKEKFYFIKEGLLPSTLLSTRANTVDYLAIYDHDLASSGASIVLQCSDNNSAWSNLFSPIYPSSSSPIFMVLQQSSHKYWRIQVSGAQSSIGVLMLGVRLDFANGLTFGFSPPALAQQFMPRTNISADGEFIGRSISKKPISGNLVFNPVFSRSWVRQFWPELIRHMERKPFFVFPEEPYPDEALFCWADQIHGPEYSSTFMSLRIPIKAKAS